MLMKIVGRVRGLFAGNYPENDENQQFHINSRGDQLVCCRTAPIRRDRAHGQLVDDEDVDGVRRADDRADDGRRAHVAERLPSGRSVADHRLGVRLAARHRRDAAGLLGDLPHAVNKTSDAAATGTDVTTNTKSMSGRGAYGGKTKALAASTVVDNGWSPIGNPSAFATAFAGALWRTADVEIAGKYIVPPGASYSVHVVELAGAASQLQIGIRFHEAQLITVS
jgi:hypothetical protein